MRRGLLSLAGALVLAMPVQQLPLPLPEPFGAPDSVQTAGATLLAGGLAFPAGFSFLPAGRIVYGERFTGEVRFLDPATGSDTLVWTIPGIASAGEQGLLGVASHPDYPSSPFLYAYATRTVNGAPQNQVIRIRVANGAGTGMKVLVRIKAGTIHNGGAMVMGPGGNLHVGTGEVGIPANAQDTARLTGKVLRLKAGGAAAAGNPFGNRVFSFGHRNIFGIAIDPETGRLWVSENGPGCNDEINDLVNGGNFAWGPNQSCGTPADAEDTNRDGPAPRRFPSRLYNPTIAPTGAVFCDGCGLGSATEGTLLFGAWNDGGIRRVTLNAARNDATASSLLHDHSSGVLGMARAPDGRVYFSDSDEIYRLTP